MLRLSPRAVLLALALPLSLAACSGSEEADATGEPGAQKGTMPDVSIKAKGADGGDVAITANRVDRRVSIQAGEFSMNMKVPDWVDLSGKSSMDIDGVGLPTGATVTGVNVTADDTTGGPGKANVDVRFDAPMKAAAAADWYAKSFADKSVAVTRDGTTIRGRNAEGTPFVITLTDAGSGSKGHINLTENGAKP